MGIYWSVTAAPTTWKALALMTNPGATQVMTYWTGAPVRIGWPAARAPTAWREAQARMPPPLTSQAQG